MLFTIFCGFRKIRFKCYSQHLKMETSRSSTQTIRMTSSNVVETFVYLPFEEVIKIGFDLLVLKKIIFFTSTFPLLQSTVQMQSFRFSTQKMTTNSSNIVETFVLNTICRSLGNDD